VLESHILIHSLSKQAEEAVRPATFFWISLFKRLLPQLPETKKTVRNRHLADSCWKRLALPRDSTKHFFIRSAGNCFGCWMLFGKTGDGHDSD
jgi:hypothetical protein